MVCIKNHVILILFNNASKGYKMNGSSKRTNDTI